MPAFFILRLHAVVAALAVGLSFSASPVLAAPGFVIGLTNGPLPAAGILVEFTPRIPVDRSWQAMIGGHSSIAFQTNAEGKVLLQLTSLQAAETRTIHFEPGHAHQPVRALHGAELKGGTLIATADGAPMYRYEGLPTPLPRPGIRQVFQRGGYIHPLYTPSGLVVTDDYATNHLHHHGIWFAWSKTEFMGRHPDFWNVAENSGTVLAKGVERYWSGPVANGFVGNHDFIDLTSGQPTVALKEQWICQAFATTVDGQQVHVIDLSSTQNCLGTNRVLLTKYLYGGIGYRGPENWGGTNGCNWLTSEGESIRVKAHGTKARWCRVTGYVSGIMAGVALLDHPANMHAPQPLRVNPTEPFLCLAPPQESPFSIEPGKPYISKYRIVVFDGELPAASLDQLWEGFAHPPTVSTLP